MPALVCSAMTCIYNKGELCCKGDIHVGGNQAKMAGETCCESFRARKDNQAESSLGTPDQKIQVGCDACTCQYNEQHNCTAARINIVGASACRCEQTECGTFHCGK